MFVGPPFIISPLEDLHVLSGANATFFCVGLGHPNPTLTWLKDSKPVQFSKRVVYKREDSALWVLGATLDDAGTYTCVYKNKYGKARKSAMLFVDGIEPGKCECIAGGVG